ncbi:hypothetical protein PR048_016256 [Dryococelus australis]|uniref:Reverse transcriptase domain-containing protein n=1 Tax=Dryococelus australis TaxID=614101 RepID=A0ABQ9HJ91_9NEOP|nr:hypothetical protein PR048_016256 [Dryococelus australis]
MLVEPRAVEWVQMKSAPWRNFSHVDILKAASLDRLQPGLAVLDVFQLKCDGLQLENKYMLNIWRHSFPVNGRALSCINAASGVLESHQGWIATRPYNTLSTDPERGHADRKENILISAFRCSVAIQTERDVLWFPMSVRVAKSALLRRVEKVHDNPIWTYSEEKLHLYADDLAICIVLVILENCNAARCMLVIIVSQCCRIARRSRRFASQNTVTMNLLGKAVSDLIFSPRGDDNSQQVYLQIFQKLLIVSTTIFLRKNLRGVSNNMFKSFLEDRKQITPIRYFDKNHITNVMSNTRTTRVGVPQGSILGLIVLLIFINDFPEQITNGSAIMFADDTNILATNTNPIPPSTHSTPSQTSQAWTAYPASFSSTPSEASHCRFLSL